ncbi:hypothetical protein ScPMuIL_000495 [Solemya velum]
MAFRTETSHLNNFIFFVLLFVLCQIQQCSLKSIDDGCNEKPNSITGGSSVRRNSRRREDGRKSEDLVKVGGSSLGKHFRERGDANRQSDRKASAGEHFLFWKTITKLVIPQVQYTQKATQATLVAFCGVLGKDMRNNECFGDAQYLLNEWPSADFMRTPSKHILKIKKQHKFEKALMKDLILVLRNHKHNLTQMLEKKKTDFCKTRGGQECSIVCTSPLSFDEDQSKLYCDINHLILPHLSKVLNTLKKEAKRYFKIRVKTPALTLHSPTPKIYLHNSHSHQLAVLYNIMEQCHETEAALEYLAEISSMKH